jgi:hypothetical protein
MLRQHLRGWPKNISGHYKNEKKEILNTLHSLDKNAENIPLQLEELNLMQQTSTHVA